MISIDNKDRKKYSHFFEECEDACIITALEGYGGNLWVNNPDKPECALIIVGSFAFLAGNSDSKDAKEITAFIDSCFEDEFNIRCVSEGFAKIVQDVYGERVSSYSRFATKRSFDGMDFDKLKKNVKSLSPDYSIRLLDGELFNYCKNNEWAEDFVISFEDEADWNENGLGIMICDKNVPIAGASSYSSYPGGIEVEIVTKESYRKQGLATIAGSALLLECKKRNLLASWDAAHKQSLKLAMKLGFEFLYEYVCYSITKKAP